MKNRDQTQETPLDVVKNSVEYMQKLLQECEDELAATKDYANRLKAELIEARIRLKVLADDLRSYSPVPFVMDVVRADQFLSKPVLEFNALAGNGTASSPSADLPAKASP